MYTVSTSELLAIPIPQFSNNLLIFILHKTQPFLDEIYACIILQFLLIVEYHWQSIKADQQSVQLLWLALSLSSSSYM